MRDQKRSEAIELVLQWALEKGKRIITASATVGEIERIADWLNAEIIRADKRPVPLFEYVKYGNKLINKEGKVIELKKDLIEYILDKGKNILIFENTRKRAESEYDRLKSIYGNKVILFHGGLSREEREEALQKIIKGEAKIVVSTTALGQGVNLPIYCVLLKEMELPQIENGRFVGWRRLTINEYKQIAGRAGRPRFDKEGIAIIEAKSEYQAKLFTNYLKDNYESIRSYLTPFKFILVHLSRNETETENELLTAIKYTYTLRNTNIREIKLLGFRRCRVL
jgi:helicase